MLRYTSFLGVLAEGLGRAGRAAEGIAIIDEALAISEHHEELWSVAELLRVKAGLMLLDVTLGSALAAEDCFLQALDWARKQSALSWELRAATSLAQLWRSQARSQEAHQLLAPVYGRFTEGFETADLTAAGALLEELCQQGQ